MDPTNIQKSALGNLTKLGRGGQGTVFKASRAPLILQRETVYKEYHSDKLNEIEVSVLREMVAFLASLPFAHGENLVARAAWPVRLVEEGSEIVGFLMPCVPSQFTINLRVPYGVSQRLAQVQHWLNDAKFLSDKGITLTDRDRYELLYELAASLDLFHGHKIGVGDLSPKNVLISLLPNPSVYFIDCDSMRFRIKTVLPQVETPSWDIRTISLSEDLATPQTDRYKFGLFVLRLFAGDQTTWDHSRLPSGVPDVVRSMVERSFSPNGQYRPQMREWLTPLKEAARFAAKVQTPLLPITPNIAHPTTVTRSPQRPKATPGLAPTSSTVAKPTAATSVTSASGTRRGTGRTAYPWGRLIVGGVAGLFFGAIAGGAFFLLTSVDDSKSLQNNLAAVGALVGLVIGLVTEGLPGMIGGLLFGTFIGHIAGGFLFDFSSWLVTSVSNLLEMRVPAVPYFFLFGFTVLGVGFGIPRHFYTKLLSSICTGAIFVLVWKNYQFQEMSIEALRHLQNNIEKNIRVISEHKASPEHSSNQQQSNRDNKKATIGDTRPQQVQQYAEKTTYPEDIASGRDSFRAGTIRYLSSTSGDPGVPGDGKIISWSTSTFKLDSKVPLAGIKGGITLSFFLPNGVSIDERNLISQVDFSVPGKRHCGGGWTGGESKPIPAINGSPGIAIILSQHELNRYLNVERKFPGCEDVELKDVVLEGASMGQIINNKPVHIHQLDALALGIGAETFAN